MIKKEYFLKFKKKINKYLIIAYTNEYFYNIIMSLNILFEYPTNYEYINIYRTLLYENIFLLYLFKNFRLFLYCILILFL